MKPICIVFALAMLTSVGCGPEVLAEAKLGSKELELVDARGSVELDGEDLVVTLVGWDDPSCSIADDERSVKVKIRVLDRSAVVLGQPINVAAVDAPVEVELSMGSMGSYCQTDCETPEYVITGSVTLDSLSEQGASGSVDLQLVGDVPNSSSDGIYAEDTTLQVAWKSFAVPMDIEHCD